MSRRLALQIGLALALVGLAPAAAQATTCSWVATSADGWDNPSAWKYGGSSGCGGGSSVPGSDDDVVFSLANSGECNVSLDVTVQSVTITSASNQGGIVANPTLNTIRVTNNWSQAGNSFNSNTTSYPIGKLIIGGNFSQTGGTFKIPPVFAVGGTFSRSGGTFTSQTGSTVILNSTSAQSHTLGGSSFANFAVNDGLIAYWKLDESADGSGAAGLDSSGWGHNLTYQSTPTHTTTTATTTFTNPYALSVAKVSGASYGEYAELASYPSTLKPTVWSISAWAKSNAATDSSGSEIINIGDDYGLRVLTDGNVRVHHIESGSHKHCQSTDVDIRGGWHHILGTYNGTTFTLYIDGVAPSPLLDTNAAATCTGFSTQTFSGTSLRIGGHPGNGNYDFDGIVDDVRIYNRVLTAIEAAQLFAGGQPDTSQGTHTMDSTLTVTGDLIIGSGTLAMGSSVVNLTGSWFNYGGGFTGTGAVSFLGTTTGYDIRSNHQVMPSITFNGSGGGWTLEQPLNVGGVTTMTAGTLDAGSYALHTANITKTSGTFTASTGTVVLGSSSSSAGVNLGVTSLNNLRVEDPTETNLVAYWKLDEGEGATAWDWAGSGWKGTTVNGPTWLKTGLSGIKFYNPAAMTFDGSNDYVQITGTTFKNPITISAWIYRTADGSSPRIVNLPYARLYASTVSAGTTGGVGFVQDCSSGVDGDWKSGSLPYTYSGWHHVAATYDGTSSSNLPVLYIDGTATTLTTVTAATQTCLSGSGTGYIGSSAGANPFTGSIDDVRVYDAVLTPAQIASLAAGRYANTGGAATVTLSGNSTIGKKLSVDSGGLASSSYTMAVAGSDTTQITDVYTGTLALGSTTNTLSGGLNIAADGTVTTGAGAVTLGNNGTYTLEVAGNMTTAAGTVTLGAKQTNVNSGGTLTIGGGTTIASMDVVVAAGGTLKMNATSGILQMADTKNLYINGTLQTTTGTATPKPKITTGSGRMAFVFGQTAVTAVADIDGLSVQNTDNNGLYFNSHASATTTFTNFKNVDFLGTTSGTYLLRIEASSLNLVADALTFNSTNTTSNINVRVNDRDATPSGSDVRVFLGATCTISAAAADCEAKDSDADTGNDNKADDSGNGGAVAFWGLRGHTDLAGTIEGFPSSSFDWTTFAHWRTYAVYNNASGIVDRLYARDDDTYTDGRAGYYWDLTNGENFVGTPRWTTEGGLHYVYVLTTLGNVYKLRDTGSAFVAVGSPWDTPYRHATGGSSATATSPLIMDSSNNLFWAGNNGAGSARIFSLSSAKSLNNEFSISSNVINAVPSVYSITGTTYLFAVTNLNGANGGIYRIVSDFSDSARNSAPTSDVSGRVTVILGTAYIVDTKGKVWAFDASSSSVATSWVYQDTGTTNHAASCASDVNCLAKNLYVDVATARVFFGDKDGHVYGVYNNAGTGTALTGYPFRPGTSSDVFETSPLYRALGTNLGGIIVIGAANGNVYFIDRNNGTTGPALIRKYEFGSAVSSISYDRNSSTDGEYMIATASGRLFYINGTYITDPTPLSN